MVTLTLKQEVESCEKSRYSDFLHNRLVNGGEVERLRRRPPFTPRKIPTPFRRLDSVSVFRDKDWLCRLG
jgi:hypothetical protein